ncbi:MAG: hypothetical protein KGJ57_13810 [Sphingomonadales bacterium]|nr:hypothetical protein [Sphingomonadales bacterium]MDE2170483.1 hypothetical protein [Sphingomonadales bacterium]
MAVTFETFVDLAKANGEFATKVAQIARSGGEDYVRIVKQMTLGLVDQVKAIEPGSLPKIQTEGSVEALAEINKGREEAVAKTKAAFEELQDAWKGVLGQTANPQAGFEVFQGLLKPWFSVGAASTPAQPVKARAKAETATPPARA